jgi:hypothetical protein
VGDERFLDIPCCFVRYAYGSGLDMTESCRRASGWFAPTVPWFRDWDAADRAEAATTTPREETADH